MLDVPPLPEMRRDNLMIDNRRRVLLAMPLHTCEVTVWAAQSFYMASTNGRLRVHHATNVRSLLAGCFNTLYCTALNGDYDLFAMQHADVQPQPGWLDILVAELDRHGADMISVIIPIKSPGTNQETSTALADLQEGPFQFRKRLTLDRIYDITTADGVIYESSHLRYCLLVNTGCFVANIRRPWARKVDENGELIAHFEINDRIRRVDGEWKSETEPEDWFFSRRLHELGAKVIATTKVAVLHWGAASWNNQPREGAEDGKEND